MMQYDLVDYAYLSSQDDVAVWHQQRGADRGQQSHSHSSNSDAASGTTHEEATGKEGEEEQEERLAFTLGDGRAGVLSVKGRQVADARAKRPVSSLGQVRAARILLTVHTAIVHTCTHAYTHTHNTHECKILTHTRA